jgi:hypothetical protein
MSSRIRKRLFVDALVQGALVRRLGLYFCSAIVFVVLPSAIARTYLEPERFFFSHLLDVTTEYGPVLLTLIAMAPFVFYDALKLTNRFAGPIYRLRQQLQRFENGEDVSRIKFRDGDFWPDLAVQVNALLERVRIAEAGSAAAHLGKNAACSPDELGERDLSGIGSCPSEPRAAACDRQDQ